MPGGASVFHSPKHSTWTRVRIDSLIYEKKHLRPSEDSAPPGIDWIPSRSAGHFVIFCLKQQQKKIPGNWNMR